jgi:hypothetical protein
MSEMDRKPALVLTTFGSDSAPEADIWCAAMDVGGWLRRLGVEQYEAAFRENEIDGEVLPDLTAETCYRSRYADWHAVPDSTVAAIDAWAASRDDNPGRSEAIRRLVEIGLKGKAK